MVISVFSLSPSPSTQQHLAIQCSYQDRASAINSVLRVYSGACSSSGGGKKASEDTALNQGRAIIFCKTKRDADELVVSPELKTPANVIHGDVSQDKREMVLKVGGCFSGI